MTFTEDRIKLLNEPLLANETKSREAYGSGKLTYIEGWRAIESANRIFGFESWSTEILTLKEVNKTHYIKPPYNSGDKEKPMVAVAYLCTLRLTVVADGAESIHEDTGFGDGQAGDTVSGLHSVIELASKEAITDATKRCLRYYGNKFGLTLYEKDGGAPIDADVYEATKEASEDDLTALGKLCEERGVDRQWVETWLSAEGWGEPVENLRTDWYKSVYNAVDAIGAEERELESYEADINKAMELMNQSNTINMLKALFSEVWSKTSQHKDKERQVEAQGIYETMKAKLEKK